MMLMMKMVDDEDGLDYLYMMAFMMVLVDMMALMMVLIAM